VRRRLGEPGTVRRARRAAPPRRSSRPRQRVRALVLERASQLRVRVMRAARSASASGRVSRRCQVPSPAQPRSRFPQAAISTTEPTGDVGRSQAPRPQHRDQRAAGRDPRSRPSPTGAQLGPMVRERRHPAWSVPLVRPTATGSPSRAHDATAPGSVSLAVVRRLPLVATSRRPGLGSRRHRLPPPPPQPLDLRPEPLRWPTGPCALLPAHPFGPAAARGDVGGAQSADPRRHRRHGGAPRGTEGRRRRGGRRADGTDLDRPSGHVVVPSRGLLHRGPFVG
jgi:hypothetical protein